MPDNQAARYTISDSYDNYGDEDTYSGKHMTMGTTSTVSIMQSNSNVIGRRDTFDRKDNFNLYAPSSDFDDDSGGGLRTPRPGLLSVDASPKFTTIPETTRYD